MPQSVLLRFRSRAKKLLGTNISPKANLWKNRIMKNKYEVPIQRRRVIKKNGKVTGTIGIAFYDLHTDNPYTRFNLIFYPKEEHHKIFENAQNRVQVYGPAQRFAGSVGSIQANVRFSGGKPIILIDHIQAHFKTAPKEIAQKSTGYVERKLATEYGGWRVHLLDELFRLAKETNTPIEFTDNNPKFSKGRELSSLQARREAIEIAARKNGYTITTKPIGHTTNHTIRAEVNN